MSAQIINHPLPTPQKRHVRSEANQQRFANDASYESVRRQLHSIAAKCYARVEAMGLSMTFDDVMQEMNEGYVRAKAKWDPNGGALFITYVTRSCYNNFNDRIRKAETERRHLGLINLTDMRRVSDDMADDSDPLEFYDAAAAEHGGTFTSTFAGNGFDDYISMSEPSGGMNETPEASLERAQTARDSARKNISRLTPAAQQLVVALMMAAHEGVDLPKLSSVAEARGMTPEEFKRVKTELSRSLKVRL